MNITFYLSPIGIYRIRSYNLACNRNNGIPFWTWVIHGRIGCRTVIREWSWDEFRIIGRKRAAQWWIIWNCWLKIGFNKSIPLMYIEPLLRLKDKDWFQSIQIYCQYSKNFQFYMVSCFLIRIHWNLIRKGSWKGFLPKQGNSQGLRIFNAVVQIFSSLLSKIWGKLYTKNFSIFILTKKFRSDKY